MTYVVVVLVATVIVFAPAANGARAQTPTESGPPIGAAVPTPSPTPIALSTGCPNEAPSPLPANARDLYVVLRDRDAACAYLPNNSALKAPSPAPTTSVTPVPVAITDLPRLSFDAFSSSGLTFAIEFLKDADMGSRRVNGLPMLDNEERFAFTIAGGGADIAHHPRNVLTVEVNRYGACNIISSKLSDAQVGTCKVAAAKAGTWTAKVTLPLAILTPTLDPRPGPATYELCYVETKHAATYFPQNQQLALQDTGVLDQLLCRQIAVEYFDGAFNDGRLNEQLGLGNQNGTSSTSTGSASNSSLRRIAATSSTATTSQATSKGAPTYTITGVQALAYNARLSAETEGSDFLPALDQQTQTYLTAIANGNPSYSAGGSALGGSASNSDEFPTIDNDVFGTTFAVPYRGYDTSQQANTPKGQPKAFDSSDVLDLQSFDVSKIKSVSAGSKFTWLPDHGALGIGWFHDGSQGEAGSIVTGRYAIGDGEKFSIALANVVANNATAPTNKYVTLPSGGDPAFPTAAALPVMHSNNTVVAALEKFGGTSDLSAPIQNYMRVATNGYGRDWSDTLSYSEVGGGIVQNDAGATWQNSVIVGYRAIDYAYDPLMSPYNPLSGNQIYFFRTNVQLTTPKVTKPKAAADTDKTKKAGADGAGSDAPPEPQPASTNAPFSLSVAGVRAANGATPAYSSVGITATIPIVAHFALNPAYVRSNIANSVVARESGTYIVVPAIAGTLLPNNSTSLAFQYSNSLDTEHAYKLSIGASANNAPACSSTTVCSSPFSRSYNAAVTAGISGFILDGSYAPGSTPANSATASTIPSNQIVKTAVFAYHFCGSRRKSNGQYDQNAWGAEPSLTYKNNIAQSTSAFTAGTLLEGSMDIGPLAGLGKNLLSFGAIRVSYAHAVNGLGVPQQLAGNGITFSLVSKTQTIWQQYSNMDHCLSKQDQ